MKVSVKAVPEVDTSTAPDPNAIADAKKKLIDACMQKINAVLVEHGCILFATPNLVADGRGAWLLTADVKIRTKVE